MKMPRFVVIIPILLILTACAHKIRPEQPPGLSGLITGTVAYRERIALPPDARIIVSLEDVTRTDQGSSFVAQQVLTPNTQVPVPFALRYLPQAISRHHRYIVRAEIVDVHDALLWSSVKTYPVLFEQPAQPVAIIVTRPPVSPALVPATEHAVPFKCDDFAFIVKFGNDQAEVATPGRTLTLPRVISGSGARYSDGSTSLWNKGREATFEMNGVQYRNCRVEALPEAR